MDYIGLITKFVKFGLVGAIGMVVDFGVTWLCKEKLRWNKYISNSLGFVLAATNNYCWNRLWTFESHSDQVATEYGVFFLISLVGLGLNNLIIYLVHEKLHINFYIAKIFAIGCVTLWNFGMNYVFNFK